MNLPDGPTAWPAGPRMACKAARF